MLLKSLKPCVTENNYYGKNLKWFTTNHLKQRTLCVYSFTTLKVIVLYFLQTVELKPASVTLLGQRFSASVLFLDHSITWNLHGVGGYDWRLCHCWKKWVTDNFLKCIMVGYMHQIGTFMLNVDISF